MPVAKLPIADFRTQAQWHAYLGKLTPAQLKKVAAALNRILRIEFRLNTKKPAADLMEDIKKLYSVNNATKLLEIVKSIDADELPQPSQNLPKPTKKQAAASKEVDKAEIKKKSEEDTKIVISIMPTARQDLTKTDDYNIFILSVEDSEINTERIVSNDRVNDILGSFKQKDLLNLKTKKEFINFYNKQDIDTKINIDTKIKFFIDTNYGSQFEIGQGLLQGGSQSKTGSKILKNYLDAPPSISYGNPGVIYHHLTKIVKIK
jgi:hypothetical protein